MKWGGGRNERGGSNLLEHLGLPQATYFSQRWSWIDLDVAKVTTSEVITEKIWSHAQTKIQQQEWAVLYLQNGGQCRKKKDNDIVHNQPQLIE